MTQFLWNTDSGKKRRREEKNMQLVRKGAGECMVLLENDGVLPFKKDRKDRSFTEQEQDIPSRAAPVPVMSIP